jgi:hypothetical protein
MMRQIAAAVLVCAGVVAAQAWFALCIMLPLMLLGSLDMPDEWYKAALAAGCAFGGLWFALWVCKRLTRSTW